GGTARGQFAPSTIFQPGFDPNQLSLRAMLNNRFGQALWRVRFKPPLSSLMETTMKFGTSTVFGVILALTLGSVGLISHAAEKKDLTYVKTYSKSISKSSFAIDDVPNHEILQELMAQHSKYSSADFQPVEEWLHTQTDQRDGSGTHKGYYILIFQNGEQTY